MDPTTGNREEHFLDLVEPLRAGLLRFCRALSPDRETAKDIASEAILIAFERFDKLREKQAMQSYLYTTASRLAKKSRERLEKHSPLASADAMHSHEAAPDVLADIRLLQEAMEKLPGLQREAVILFEISGLSLAEIQVIQGGSISAVKMRISRGREQLAKLLGVRQKNAATPEGGKNERIVNQRLRTFSV